MPVAAAPTAGSIFRNVDNASSAAQLDGRKIDPVTRQYDFDANGRVVGQTTAQQLVLLALSTTLGSSSMQTLGHTLQSIDVIGPDIQRQVSGILTAALQPYVTAKQIAILSISVVARTAGTSGVIASVRWRDLANNTDQTTTQTL